MTIREYSPKFVKLSRYATSLMSNRRDEMSRFLTWITEVLEKECRADMLHDSMDLSRLMVHVQQVEESRKRKHTRAGNWSRQVEKNFSRMSSIEIRDNPRFKKGLYHKGESSSSKGRYDRNFESIVKRNNEVDTPQERPPCRNCVRPAHMVKDCPNRRSQEQGKERFQPNCPSEEAPRRQRFFALKFRGAGDGISGEVSGA
ncbi:uncharacterized protein [Solanum lycopersicum]|uniref:uncharacterized protein n=1 Tax=Solanum lycopersicum TaxID=4081 RepID=UPI00374A50AB